MLENKRLIVSAVVLIGVILFGMLMYQQQQARTLLAATDTLERTSRTRFSRIAAEPQVIARATPTPTPENEDQSAEVVASPSPVLVLSPACEQRWTDVAQNSTEDLVSDIERDFFVPQDNSCSSEANLPLRERLVKACAKNSQGGFVNATSCRTSARFYRAYVVAKLTDGQPLESLPLGVLVNRYLAAGKAVAGTANLEEQRTIANLVLQREPQNPSTYKMLTATEMSAELPNLQQGEQWAEEGLRTSPDDQELQLALMWFKYKGDPRSADQYVSENPQMVMGEYARAGNLWNQQGGRAKAQQILSQLAAANPDNRLIQSSQAALQNPLNRTSPFRVQFSINEDEW